MIKKFICLILFIIVSLCLVSSDRNYYKLNIEQITYEQYNDCTIIITDESPDIFTFLDNLLIEKHMVDYKNLNKNIRIETYDNKLLQNNIPRLEHITDISKSIHDNRVSYSVQYDRDDNRRVVLEIHQDGSIGKSIYYKEYDTLIVVNNVNDEVKFYIDITKPNVHR